MYVAMYVAMWLQNLLYIRTYISGMSPGLDLSVHNFEDSPWVSYVCTYAYIYVHTYKCYTEKIRIRFSYVIHKVNYGSLNMHNIYVAVRAVEMCVSYRLLCIDIHIYLNIKIAPTVASKQMIDTPQPT